GAFPPQGGERVLIGAGAVRLEAVRMKYVAKQIADRLLVFDDEDAGSQALLWCEVGHQQVVTVEVE
ncbi:MAG TPA: hypothetical protein VHK87_09745, partial [Phenylobacterium sp.]|nr:hypothetical protein [Phenylobacterium sp.]